MVLEQVGGPYRIPVVVGVSEAQSIAVRLENIVPPRPMPHDIMVSMSHGFGISLDEVFIYKFDDGVFLSELRFSNDDRHRLAYERCYSPLAAHRSTHLHHP